MFENSVPTAKKTQRASITKIGWLVLFREIIVVTRNFQDLPEMNAYWADHECLSVCPSVRMIQLENRWTDFDGSGIDIKPLEAILPVLLNLIQSAIPTWWANEHLRWKQR
jgi:hypothetical protein